MSMNATGAGNSRLSERGSKTQGGEPMAKIYYRWIKADRMTIDDVPTKWRDTVREMLEEDEA